jgi:hypothetical protein
MKTFGIIFYEIINNKMNIYLKKNNKDYYEDIIHLNNEDINNNLYYISDLISPIFKFINKDHNILILNKNKYINIYNLITFNKNINIQKISLEWFCNKNVHNNLKHKRIKEYELINVLRLIDLNYKIKL